MNVRMQNKPRMDELKVNWDDTIPGGALFVTRMSIHGYTKSVFICTFCTTYTYSTHIIARIDVHVWRTSRKHTTICTCIVGSFIEAHLFGSIYGGA